MPLSPLKPFLDAGDGAGERSTLLLDSSLCDRLLMVQERGQTLLLDSSLCDRLAMVQQLVQQIEENYPDEQVDWEIVHDAGCTCDDTELPHHVTARDDIITMVNTSFVGLLDSLPGPPTIITISSTQQCDRLFHNTTTSLSNAHKVAGSPSSR
uniref:Uncharacterized protein n=1 Tax=Timema cristinae TaxID=61476 RepID=A0A7R9D6B6_TIMCR|nr:unnamed protein product [Timema cristinae]